MKTTKKNGGYEFNEKAAQSSLCGLKRRAIIVTVFICSVCAFAFSQDKAKKKDKIDFGGNAEVGISYEAVGGLREETVNDGKLKRIGAVEIELKILPADNVELEFDLEYDHRFTDVNLEKLFVRYNFSNSNARLGFMKKMFTLEEIKNKNDRLFIKKSMLNSFLDEFFLLGHEFTAQYRYYFPSYTLIGGYTSDGNVRNFVNATMISQLSENLRGTVAAMYEVYYLDKNDFIYNFTHAFFGNVGLEFDGRGTDFEVEAVWGINPEQYGGVHIGNREYGESRVNIWGLRFQQSWTFDIMRQHLNAIVPLYEVSYFNDSFLWRRAYWQARAGVNLCFTPKNRLQWRNNVEMVVTARNQNSRRPQIISERALSEIIVFW